MSETTYPLPKTSEFWRNKRSGTRVCVRCTLSTRPQGVMLTDVDEGEAIDLGFRFLDEFLDAYERIGTVDEAHAAALAEIGAETCDECNGSGEEAEHIDAPDYRGPATCQACMGLGWWRPLPELDDVPDETMTESGIRADERAKIVRELMAYADSLDASVRETWPNPRSVKRSEMEGRAEQVRYAARALAEN